MNLEILNAYDHLVIQVDDKKIAAQHTCQRFGISMATPKVSPKSTGTAHPAPKPK
jgi:hypothetical protein